MKIKLVAVGKVKERFFADGIAEYLKRCGRWVDVSVIEIDDCAVKENAVGARTLAMEREADKILPVLGGFVIALDIDGKTLTSEELASAVKKGLETSGEVCFVIGGSYGLSPRVKNRADLRLSFGRVTFPHQLVRQMTAEQIYRSLTLIAGHPYHK